MKRRRFGAAFLAVNQGRWLYQRYARTLTLNRRQSRTGKDIHTAMNIAAISGPMTNPLRPKTAMPPSVAINIT
jgi:hypothetical protein